MSTPDHNKLIAKIAKSVLAPIGCIQKGKSRVWLDDHGWWVGVIEFQPSAWAKGSYLNVGAHWLWYEKEFFSFDDGADAGESRVESFHQFDTGEQFEASVTKLAQRSVEEIIKLRCRHSSVAASATYLRQKKAKDIWGRYHAGVSAGLTGDTATARNELETVMRDKFDFPWVLDLKQCTAVLLQEVHDTAAFRTRISGVVARSRTLLKLPERVVTLEQ